MNTQLRLSLTPSSLPFPGRDSRRGLGRRARSGLLRRSDARSADPLAVESDLACDLADLLSAGVDGVEGGGGEFLARLLLGCHGGAVGAAESSKGLPALVIHGH